MLQLYRDTRLGGITQYVLAKDDSFLMQFPKELLDCVTFLGYTNEGGERIITGTGFFVSKAVNNDKYKPIYLVTALHNVTKVRDKGLKNIDIRLNTSDNIIWVSIPIDEFYSHPEQAEGYECIDVAVAKIQLNSDIDNETFSINLLATDVIIEMEQVTLGDEIAIVGLFTNHIGKQKNQPIVRIGNICAMPTDKVETRVGSMQAYLVEARSMGGISGSPVLVHLESMRGTTELIATDSGTAIATTYAPPKSGNLYYCIGLVHGHYDIDEITHDAVIDDFIGSKKQNINMGVAIVVPSNKIIETINQPHFLDMETKK